jgi:hypothetical protein
MVLHPKALKDRGRAVVTMDGAGYRYGALGQKESVALVLGYIQMIGDLLELAPGHVEYGPIVEGAVGHDLKSALRMAKGSKAPGRRPGRRY